MWNCTTGICQAHVACYHTGTYIGPLDSTQTDWSGFVFLDPVLILNGYLKYANFKWPSKIEIGPKNGIELFLKPGLSMFQSYEPEK